MIKHNPKIELLQIKEAMLARVHQDNLFGKQLDIIFKNIENFSDKQRLAIGMAITSMLCEFMRESAIRFHESEIENTHENKKFVMNMIQRFRTSVMDRLNIMPNARKIKISGFTNKPRDPYGYRTMDVGYEDS